MRIWIRSHIQLSYGLIAVFSILFLGSADRFRPASEVPEDLMIGVASWRNGGGESQDVQGQTYDRLVPALKDLGLDVGIIKIPAQLNNAGDVDAIAAAYGVDVLVWGWYDETAVRGYVDLANATEQNGMTNSLGQFLDNGGDTDVIRVLKVLSGFEYEEDGVYFCVPRWQP